MATGYFYLTNNSPGAPSLTNAAGSLINVLDWALDIGAPGAYWEKVYTGTNVAVYRATTGQRYYLRVDDNIGQVARMIGYETMSDVDTGTEPFPTSGSGTGYMATPKSENAAAKRFWIVGDSRVFWMVIEHPVGSFSFIKNLWGFGEVNPLDPLDAYCTILFGCANNSGTTAGWTAFNNDGFYNGRAFVGAVSSTAAPDCSIRWANIPDGTNSSVSGYFITFARQRGACPIYNNLSVFPIMPMYATNGTGDLTGDDPFSALRGRIPYLYFADCQILNGLAEGDVIQVGAEEYEVVTMPNSTSVAGSNTDVLLIRTTNNEPGRV